MIDYDKPNQTMADLKVGCEIEVLVTGSFSAVVTELNDNYFKIQDEYHSIPNIWFDRNLLRISHDWVFTHKDRICVHQTDLYKAIQRWKGYEE